jgi:hypothetical protein
VSQNAIVIPVRAVRRMFIVLAVLIVLIILLLLARQQLSRAGIATLFAPSALELIDGNSYQAVFLTGGQVYFGRLQQQGSLYFVLYDVFYLSVPSDSGAQPQLIKRGSEIQAPVEPMIIPAGQVLYLENLRPDGQVATAIRRFKAGEIPSATPPPLATPTSTARPSPSPTR